MASIKVTFQSKSFVEVAKMQQQIINQMRPLGYEFDNLISTPISGNKIETTIILVYKKRKAKKETETPWGSKKLPNILEIQIVREVFLF